MKKRNATKEVAHSIRQSLAKTGQVLELERPTEFIQAPTNTTALSALARSAGNGNGNGHHLVVTRLSDTLEEDSALFIKYCYKYLQLNKCPGDAREIILVILALSNARFDKFHEITQKQMAEFMGQSQKTVSRKLRALETWECTAKRAVIILQQRDYGEDGHFKTTRYKPTIAAYVGEFMRRVVTGRAGQSNGYEAKAFTEQAQKFLKKVGENGQGLLLDADLSAFERADERSIAEEIFASQPKVSGVQKRRVRSRKEREGEEVRDESEEAAVLRAQAVILEKQVKKLKTKAKALAPIVTSNRLDALARARRRLLETAETWCELLYQNGIPLSQSVIELQPDLQEIINRFGEAYGG